MSRQSLTVANNSQLRPFFTPRTLAEYLSISERTVRQMLADGRIPSYKIEGLRRVDPTDVDRYLQASKEIVPAPQERPGTRHRRR